MRNNDGVAEDFPCLLCKQFCVYSDAYGRRFFLVIIRSIILNILMRTYKANVENEKKEKKHSIFVCFSISLAFRPLLPNIKCSRILHELKRTAASQSLFMSDIKYNQYYAFSFVRPSNQLFVHSKITHKHILCWRI